MPVVTIRITEKDQKFVETIFVSKSDQIERAIRYEAARLAVSLKEEFICKTDSRRWDESTQKTIPNPDGGKRKIRISSA